MRISDWSSDVCSSDLLVDHRSAALIGGHGVQQFLPPPARADAGRAVELVRGKDVEIAIQRLHVDGEARHCLAAIDQDFRADAVGDVGGAATVEHARSEEHTSELQSLMRISYAV